MKHSIVFALILKKPTIDKPKYSSESSSSNQFHFSFFQVRKYSASNSPSVFYFLASTFLHLFVVRTNALFSLPFVREETRLENRSARSLSKSLKTFDYMHLEDAIHISLWFPWKKFFFQTLATSLILSENISEFRLAYRTNSRGKCVSSRLISCWKFRLIYTAGGWNFVESF